MMMLIRTHYVIDMITGVIVAHYMHILGERLSYLVDVKIMRQHVTKGL
jgi:phage-related holin